MIIELKRYRYRRETIDGYIYIDNKKVCDCAENARHCLKVGNHKIASGWNTFGCGNGVYHRKNKRILVGEYLVPGCLIHSKIALDALCERIRKALKRKKDVYLVITRNEELLYKSNT